MEHPYLYNIWHPVFDNDNDALFPEVWAQEALINLENNCLGVHAVHRDFDDEIAFFGKVVNAHRPSSMEMKRKGLHDDLVDQDATSTSVPVPLNQHLYTSFIIKDGEEAYAFKRLRDMYMVPAMEAINQGIDRIIMGQVYRFIGNSVGGLSTTGDKALAIALDKKCTDLNIPLGYRNCFISSALKAELLNIAAFTEADKRGDGGEAFKRAEIGEVLGVNYYQSNNVPNIPAGTMAIADTGAINNGAGYPAGTKTFTVDGFTGAVEVGGWITIAGDMTPLKVVAATTTEITTLQGLRTAVVDDATVTGYEAGLINLSAGYAAGYLKSGLTIDGITGTPASMQMVSLDPVGGVVSTEQYAAIGTPTTTDTGLLDRPLAAGISNNDLVGFGPAGSYSFCFHPHAIALVTRPLPAPAAAAGAMSAVASYNDLTVRVVITYDHKAQGHRVSIDLLAGIAQLNANLGVAVYS
jgi:hypothetical protein